jgi:uncharacterized protein involved in response to NO
MNHHRPSGTTDTAPLWQLAFRAGFLSAAAFAVAAMLRWLGWLWVPGDWPAGVSPHWWHGHEMIFGFAMPVVAGFLLTAVATWTGLPGTRGTPLLWLFGLWLLARSSLWLASGNLWLAWLAEMGFLAILLWELTRRVWARRQWRNMLFTPVILVLAALDTASHAGADDPLLSAQLHYGAVGLVTVFVVIIGGRVIPLFTANRLGLAMPTMPAWLDYLAVASVALIALLVALLPSALSSGWLGWLCLATGLLHLYRLAHWQGWKTLRVPLLWSLHLSYLCIPLALAGLGFTAGDPVAVNHLIHLLAVGTIGGMILAMMSRVALGHTGRPLEVPRYIAVAFALVLLAAATRALVPLLWIEQTLPAWRLSALLWIVAFSAFLIRYTPILTRPRIDGKPG